VPETPPRASGSRDDGARHHLQPVGSETIVPDTPPRTCGARDTARSQRGQMAVPETPPEPVGSEQMVPEIPPRTSGVRDDGTRHHPESVGSEMIVPDTTQI
jgi:hypothetical protein